MRDVTLCVLAGGESKRMGRAKAELVVGGKPILQHLLDRINWDGPTLLITAPGRERPPACESFDREAVDPVFGAGPLRGLLTALENLQTEIAVVISVDMPFVERIMIDWMIEHMTNTTGLMMRDQPFPSVYRVSAIDAVRARLRSGKPSMFSLFDEPGFATLNPPQWNPVVWTNLNTPADLTALGLQ